MYSDFKFRDEDIIRWPKRVSYEDGILGHYWAGGTSEGTLTIHNKKTGEDAVITHGLMARILHGEMSDAIIDAYFALLNERPSSRKYWPAKTREGPSHFLSLSVLRTYDSKLKFLRAYQDSGTDYIEEEARLYLPVEVATDLYVLVVIDLRKHYIRIYDSVKERAQRHILKKAVELVVNLKQISRERYELITECSQTHADKWKNLVVDDMHVMHGLLTCCKKSTMTKSGLCVCMMAKIINNGVPLSYTSDCETVASERILIELTRGFVDYRGFENQRHFS